LHLYASEEIRSTLKYTTLSEPLLQSLTTAIESDKDTGKLQAEAAELAKKVAAPLKFLAPGNLPGMQDGRPFGSG